MADSEIPPERGTDVVLVHSPLENERGYNVLRAREGRLEVGTLAPLIDGKPVTGEILSLKARQDSALYDVEVHHSLPPAPGPSGPAQVATASYRQGWDRIFGTRASVADEPPAESRIPSSRLN